MRNNSHSSAPRRGQTRHPVFSPWYLLLLAPFVALLWPPFYFRAQPVAWGFPYFYFYQFVWLVIGAVLTWFVYRITQREDER